MNPVAFVAVRSEDEVLVEVAVVRVDHPDRDPAGAFSAQLGPDPNDHWLASVLAHLAALCRNATLAAFDVESVIRQLDSACERVGAPSIDLHSPVLELRALAWPLVLSGEAQGTSFEDVCTAFGAGPPVHTFARARAAADVYTRLVRRFREGARVERLAADEGQLLRLLLDRLEQGRAAYGPWRVHDGRQYPREALMEVVDALHYCAAELLRLGPTEAP